MDSPTAHAEFSASLGPLRSLNLLLGAGLDSLPSPYLQLDGHLALSKLSL